MMFTDIPERTLNRMRELEAMDQADRQDGTAHLDRLRQIPQETGRFLALMAACAPQGNWLEIGTSAGYSSLWLSLACRARGKMLTTYEILPQKIALARETLSEADVESLVQLEEGDGLMALKGADGLAFCFLDADKPRSMEYLEEVTTRLVPGGLFLVDNAISHQDIMGKMIEVAAADSRLDSTVIPVGKGVLTCRLTDET
jgi:predicted O-methyltransferase YrrM